jgi:heme-degrading monooxygenase HmoA
MIRVIANYEVQPGREQDFIDAWQRVTRTIRTTARGSMGALLTRDVRDKQTFVAVSRWDTVDDFVRFNNVGMLGSAAEKTLKGTLNGGVALQVVEEVAELTVFDEPVTKR